MTSRRKLHTENPQISGSTVQKFGHPEFVHRWLKEPQGYIFKRSQKRRTVHTQQGGKWISLNAGKHNGTRRRKTDSGFRRCDWETNTGVETIKWKTRSRWNYKKKNKFWVFMLPATSNASSLILHKMREDKIWHSGQPVLELKQWNKPPLTKN